MGLVKNSGEGINFWSKFVLRFVNSLKEGRLYGKCTGWGSLLAPYGLMYIFKINFWTFQQQQQQQQQQQTSAITTKTATTTKTTTTITETYFLELTIFGLNGGCTSRFSIFSQSILRKN